MTREESKKQIKRDWKSLSGTQIADRIRNHFKQYGKNDVKISVATPVNLSVTKDITEIFDGTLGL